jgi:hypothetical protein
MPTGGAIAHSAHRRIGVLVGPSAGNRNAAGVAYARSRFTVTTLAAGRWRHRRHIELADLKGLHYLRHLVERPGTRRSPRALRRRLRSSRHAAQLPTPVNLDTAAHCLPPTARRARHRARYGDAPTNMPHRKPPPNDALLTQPAASWSLRRRARQRAGLIAVRKAIAATITQIDRHDPSLARHLRDSSTPVRHVATIQIPTTP